MCFQKYLIEDNWQLNKTSKTFWQIQYKQFKEKL